MRVSKKLMEESKLWLKRKFIVSTPISTPQKSIQNNN